MNEKMCSEKFTDNIKPYINNNSVYGLYMQVVVTEKWSIYADVQTNFNLF